MRLSRTAETVLGLAVVAAIAATAFFARRQPAVPSGGTSEATRSRPGTADDVPDLSQSDATIDLGDLRILVSAGPRPLRAFSRNRFRFRAEAGGVPLTLADAAVSFTMTMPMGDHHYGLVMAADGWQEAEAVLPLCPSGKRRWFGRLDFRLAGQARSARFALDLAAPDSRTP